MASSGETTQTLVVEGIRLHHAGDMEGAGRLFEAALERDPGDTDARCLLGLVRQQQGRAAEAVGLIESALVSRPDVPSYHAGLGMAYRTLGRPADSARAFAKVLELCPADAEAHVNWAIAIGATGDRDAVLEHLRRAVDLDPRHGQARSRLGELLLELDRPLDALPHCQAAVELRPGQVESHLNLADACLALGRNLEARASYQRALRLDPDRGPAAAGLGIAAVRLQIPDEGLAWLRRAVELEPNSVEFLRQLGEAASTYGLRDEVRRCCDRMLAIDPDNASAHNTLGSIAHREGRRDEARARYLDAVRLEPRLANAHFNLGILHEELGEKDDAEARFRMALSCDASHATALARIASMRRGTIADADVQAIHRLLESSSLPPTHCLKLLFGLADIHDGRSEFSLAADWLERANALGRDLLRMRGCPYSPDEHRRFLDDIVGAFTPALFQRLAGAGRETQRPVFIVGMPRSGTTLIEQVLASHPEVHGAGEIHLVRQSLDAIPGMMTWTGAPLEGVKRLLPLQVAELSLWHEERLRAIDGGRSIRIVDKLPENYFYLGLIALLFPRAVVIHCRRDPRDVALSCWAADFAEVRWAYQYDHIAARFSQYRRLMEHWRAVLPASFAVHDVDYEAMVDDLEGASRRLVAALGLNWDPSCLEFHKTRRPVGSASQYQVRQPIYRTSVGRWKNYEKELAELFRLVENVGVSK
ncbi:MAG: tetratricopeptide repeat-containing sulfotransferase family protein [Isosphaeraceae bacterium]